MNKKDERIAKLFRRGVTDPQKIAVKLGYKDGDPEGIQRVLDGLKRKTLTPTRE